MKTSFVRQCSLGVAAGLVFFAGCARPSAQPEQPTALSAPTLPPLVLAQAGPAPIASSATSQPAPAGQTTDAPPAAVAGDTNGPAIVERIPPTTKPENVSLAPGLAEVVKLAQAGVGEEVILAYVEKYSGRFEVGADQILYLNDLGVPEAVITSMLKHDGTPNPNVASATPSLVQTQAVSNVPQAQVAEETAPPTVSTAVAPPPTSTEVSYFYDTLSPYGSWIYLSGYGWCWQPTVAVSVSTWRPYCDRGRWYWSDAGWYWYSDYSWGWATFHYGRWYRHPGCGWVWNPGIVWAPSWVSWRYYDGYCGWAPLPPEAHFVSGVGFTYYGRHVAVGFDFGLAPYHYAFVHVNNFCDYAPYRYVVPHARVNNFYRNTTVVNNYIIRNNNVVINRGIGRETVARASQTRIREVSIREAPVSNMAHVRGDRIDRQGNQTVVYRPQLPKTPPVVRTAQFASRSGAGGQNATAVGRVQGTGGRAQSGTAASVAPAGPTHGGASRGQAQSGVAARGPGAGSVDTARPQSPARDERERPSAAPRGNASGERSVGRGSQPHAAPQRSQPSAAPQARPQREQPRANAPLFGSGTAATAPPQNNASVRAAQPQVPQSQVPAARVQQQQPNYSRATPAYPQAQVQQPAARRQNYNTGRFSDHATMPPKQFEQLPRYTPPTAAAQRPNPTPPAAAPQYSRPSAPQGVARQAPSSGGGRGEAPSRGERHH